MNGKFPEVPTIGFGRVEGVVDVFLADRCDECFPGLLAPWRSGYLSGGQVVHDCDKGFQVFDPLSCWQDMKCCGEMTLEDLQRPSRGQILKNIVRKRRSSGRVDRFLGCILAKPVQEVESGRNVRRLTGAPPGDGLQILQPWTGHCFPPAVDQECHSI